MSQNKRPTYTFAWPPSFRVILFAEEIHVLLKGILQRVNNFQFQLGLVFLGACLKVVVLELHSNTDLGKTHFSLGLIASSWISFCLAEIGFRSCLWVANFQSGCMLNNASLLIGSLGK